jgi:hypothetical protein
MQDPKADQIHVAAVLFALRSVAIFEAAKAILFLLLGCGVVDLIHNSVDAITEKIALMLRTRAIDRTPVALRNRGAVWRNSTLDLDNDSNCCRPRYICHWSYFCCCAIRVG